MTRHRDHPIVDLVKSILRMVECRLPPQVTLLVGFGRPLDPHQPNPKEVRLMAMANIGQRVPLVAKGIQSDGITEATFDGEATWAFQTPGVFELVTDDDTGEQYAKGIAAGETMVDLDIDADRTAGVRLVHGVGLLICNDPSTEAQTVEVVFGPAEDAPAA